MFENLQDEGPRQESWLDVALSIGLFGGGVITLFGAGLWALGLL